MAVTKSWKRFVLSHSLKGHSHHGWKAWCLAGLWWHCFGRFSDLSGVGPHGRNWVTVRGGVRFIVLLCFLSYLCFLLPGRDQVLKLMSL